MIGELLRIGDEVVITIPQDSREWGYNPCPDGTTATVLGFSEIHYSRICNFGLKPGVYLNRSWANVRLESGEEINENTGRMELVDKGEYEARLAVYRARPHDDWRGEKDFIRELPDTPFWEDDKVEVAGERERNLLVCGIEYQWNNGISYRISDGLSAGWHFYSSADSLTLIERGNVWKFYHDEPLQFAGLREEANFFNLLGHTTEVRNPANGLFKWTKDEVLEAIRQGVVHGFSMSGGLFGSGPHINAIRYRNEDLGQRVARMTLEGFNAPESVEVMA